MKYENKDFLSVTEFADLIGVHYNTIRNMIKSGRIDAFTIGSGNKKCYRIPRTEVMRMAEINLKHIVNHLVKQELDKSNES